MAACGADINRNSRSGARHAGGRPEPIRGGGALLHFWDAFWDLRLEECPCDVHFTRWLTLNGVQGASIFHFGPGGHHHVGIHEADAGRGNAVLGITASPQEYDPYVKLVIERPEV